MYYILQIQNEWSHSLFLNSVQASQKRIVKETFIQQVYSKLFVNAGLLLVEIHIHLQELKGAIPHKIPLHGMAWHLNKLQLYTKICK